MSRRSTFVHSLAALLTGTLFSFTSAWAQMSTAHPNAECRLKMEARLPLTPFFGHYTTPVNIGGHSGPMMIDTGASKTTIMRSVADTLAPQTNHSQAQRVAGLGMENWSEYERIVPSLKFGTSEWTDLKVLTGNILPPRLLSAQNAPVGLIGADVLSRYDVDFDFPARQMTLYTAQNCLGWFAPWPGQYYEYFPQAVRRGIFVLPVALNGHAARAVLDTGAAHTMVTRSVAFAAGVQPIVLAQAPQRVNMGVQANAFRTHLYRFDAVTIGPRTYHHIPLPVSDRDFPASDMLLGMDFMHGRRVWISYSSGRVFIQSVNPDVARRDVAAAGASGQFKPIDPTASPRVIRADLDDQDSLDDMLDRQPELSTHTHITYFPRIEVRQRTRLQMPQ
jgi:predicted aspartyl protease